MRSLALLAVSHLAASRATARAHGRVRREGDLMQADRYAEASMAAWNMVPHETRRRLHRPSRVHRRYTTCFTPWYEVMEKPHKQRQTEIAKECEGVRRSAKECEGVRRSAKECEGVRRSAKECEGVRRNAGGGSWMALP